MTQKKTTGITRRQFSTAAAATGLVAASGLPIRKAKAATAPLKIGMLLPRSGVQAQLGIDCQRGADLAKPILAELGLPPVEYMIADTETKVDVARTQAEKLVNEGAQAIIGCFDSGATMAAAQVTEQKNIPLINNIAAVPALTEQGFKWVFRNFPTGPMIVGDAFKNQKELFKLTGKAPKTVALLHINDTFGSSLAKALVALTPRFKMPYTIVENISYDPAARDLSAEVRKAKGAKADAVWVVTRLNDAILMTREMVKQRFDTMGIFSTGPGWYEKEYMEATGKFGEDHISLVPWYDAKKPLTQELIKASKKAYPDRQMTTNQTFTFEAVMTAADAYKRAGSADAKALQAALRTTNITNNVSTGPGIHFNEKGQNPDTKNSAVQNLGGQAQVILPKDRAVKEITWPMRGWRDRG